MTIYSHNFEQSEQTKRAAPRAQLSYPGKFLAVHANHPCILTSLSRTGVLIVIEEPLEIGESGFLRSGPIDHFMTVVRKEKGMNALKFDIPVSDTFVFGMRKLQEQLAEDEEADLLATARSWSEGEASSSR